MHSLARLGQASRLPIVIDFAWILVLFTIVLLGVTVSPEWYALMLIILLGRLRVVRTMLVDALRTRAGQFLVHAGLLVVSAVRLPARATAAC